MEKLNSFQVIDLTNEELVEISGGDPFMHDIGQALGAIAGCVAIAAEWFWEQCKKPGGTGDNSVLLQVSPLTLFM
jgi:hypothetical protein